MLERTRPRLIVRRADVARDLRALGFKLYDDDAIRAWVLPGIGALPFAGATAFVGYTTTFTTPGGPTNEPIPANSAFCTITIWGATSGGGKCATSAWTSSGSGGGGYCKILNRAVLPGEWGANLAITLGAKGIGATINGAGTVGGNSTVTGTLNGGAIAPAVSASQAGQQSGAARTGGAGSGGDTNQTGANGGVGDSSTTCGAGGDGATATGPQLGGLGSNLRGGGSGGGYATGFDGTSNGADGIDARIEITWS